jgi:hypothetical protein
MGEGGAVKLTTIDDLADHCTAHKGCLLWNGSVNVGGYAVARIRGAAGQQVRRHVFTDLLGKAVQPDERVVATCGNRRCVSPEHLVARHISLVNLDSAPKRARGEAKRAAKQKPERARPVRSVFELGSE